MPVNWLKLSPDIPFDLQIDYNAQRLARTAINHANWAANVETALKNPLLHGDALAIIPEPLRVASTRFGENVCDTFASHDEGGTWKFPDQECADAARAMPVRAGSGRAGAG